MLCRGLSPSAFSQPDRISSSMRPPSVWGIRICGATSTFPALSERNAASRPCPRRRKFWTGSTYAHICDIFRGQHDILCKPSLTFFADGVDRGDQ